MRLETLLRARLVATPSTPVGTTVGTPVALKATLAANPNTCGFTGIPDLLLRATFATVLTTFATIALDCPLVPRYCADRFPAKLPARLDAILFPTYVLAMLIGMLPDVLRNAGP